MLVMNSSPPGLSLLILIISTSSMFGLGSVVKKSYRHVPLHYTWDNARQNCKSYNYDLAIVETKEEKEMINIEQFYAWINLTKDNVSQIWMSIPTDQTWAANEPQPTDSCGAVSSSTQQLYGFPCENYFFFFCRDGTKLVFIAESKTMKKAQEHCKNNNMEMAKLQYSDDVSYEFPLWIRTVNGRNRRSSMPLPDLRDKCASMTTQAKKIVLRSCSDRFPSLCMTDNVILIKKKKTWEEAMKHCRQLVLSTVDRNRYELVSVEFGQDEPFLRDKASQADTMQVWVGLRFLGGTWFWADGVSMEYPDLPQCPLPGKNCGVISKTAGQLEMADCGEKKNFLCYKL